MGKKKNPPQGKPTPQPSLPPSSPRSTIVDSVSIQADLDRVKKEGIWALVLSGIGNPKKALKMIRGCISGHQDLPYLHCVEAIIHRDLAEQAAKGSYEELDHLTNAIRSAEIAVALLPNSVEYAFLLLIFLHTLATIRGKGWDKVTEACERALKIENPVHMSTDTNPINLLGFFNERMATSSEECNIEEMKKQIMQYLEESQHQKNLLLTAKKAEGVKDKEDKYRIREDVTGLPRRKKTIESIIKEMEQKETCYCVDKFQENVIVKYKRFWSSTLSSEEKRGFLKVNTEELERHLKSLKNNFVVEVFAETLCFAKERKTWKFLECCVCLKKFTDPELYKSHFRGSHWKNFESILQSLRQEEIASGWIETIVNGAWKPVDIYRVIEILINETKSEPAGTVDSDVSTEKGLGLCKDSAAVEERLQDLVGSESDGHVSLKTSVDDHQWPLSDDTERAEILERIQGIFLLLLRNRFLSPRHVHYAIQYTIQKYEGLISLSHFKCHGLETPKIVCFLGSSQLKELFNFLKNLVNICEISDISDMKIPTGINIKERVVFSEGFSSLLLDERLLQGELTNATYFDAVADDSSTITSVIGVCKDDVLPDSNEFVTWLYSCSTIGEHLKAWTRQRDSKRVKGKEVLKNILEECPQLLTTHNRISELSVKMEAIQAIDSICFEEIQNRKQCPEHVAQCYVNILRKRKKILQENDDMVSRTESDIIAEVLKEAQVALSSDESGTRDSSLEDAFEQTDNCIKLALKKLKMKLLKNMASIDTMILKRIDVIKKYELILEKLSVYDYRLIILPMLKSLLQIHLEDLFEKDAVEKSDATREALLAELNSEKSINEGCCSGKRKQHKKKKKNLRKAKESKAKYSLKHYQLPQDAVPDGNPNSDIGENADELKQLTATEERLLEKYLDNQRRFEHEASFRVNVIGTGHRNEEADCFLNVVIQSLWNLREFREEFACRSQLNHKHIGTTCVVCTLDDIFSALGTVCAANQEVVTPTSLVIALRTGFHDKNIFHKGQLNDASEFLQFILESLHESFNVFTSDFESEDEYEGSLHCFSAGCFVHRIFGMDHYERINCFNCDVESRHRKYTSCFLNLNAKNLITMKNNHGKSSFDVLLKLAEMNGQLTCESCRQLNYINHTIWCLPHVFTIVLNWQTDDESSNDISTILSALSTELNLSVLFQGYLPDNIYSLISAVCFCEDQQHYICFIYNHQHEKYVLYDDTTAKVIDSWNDVLAICKTMHFQPRILFFHHMSSIYFGD